MYKQLQGKFFDIPRLFEGALLNKVRQAKSSGFTLIELLLVIAILGVIATVVFVNLNPAGNLIDSRNARRITDVGTIESAIQNYEASNTTSAAPATLSALVPTYLGVIPVDPSTNVAYTYCAGSSASSYAIGATLESGGTATKLAAIMATSSVDGKLPAGCTSGGLVGSGHLCGTSPYYCRSLGS